jgi:hypothetical protein
VFCADWSPPEGLRRSHAIAISLRPSPSKSPMPAASEPETYGRPGSPGPPIAGSGSAVPVTVAGRAARCSPRRGPGGDGRRPRRRLRPRRAGCRRCRPAVEVARRERRGNVGLRVRDREARAGIGPPGSPAVVQPGSAAELAEASSNVRPAGVCSWRRATTRSASASRKRPRACGKRVVVGVPAAANGLWAVNPSSAAVASDQPTEAAPPKPRRETKRSSQSRRASPVKPLGLQRSGPHGTLCVPCRSRPRGAECRPYDSRGAARSGSS